MGYTQEVTAPVIGRSGPTARPGLAAPAGPGPRAAAPRSRASAPPPRPPKQTKPPPTDPQLGLARPRKKKGRSAPVRRAPELGPALTAAETARLAHLGNEQAGRGVEMLQRIINRIGVAEPVPVSGLFRGTPTSEALRATLRKLGIKGSAKDPAVQRQLLAAAERPQRLPSVRFDVSPAELEGADQRYAYDLLRAVVRDDPTLFSRVVERLVPANDRRPQQGKLRVDARLLRPIAAALTRDGLGAGSEAARVLRGLDGGGASPSFDEARAVLSAMFDVRHTPQNFFTREHDAAFARASASSGVPARVPIPLLRALVAQETQFRPTTRPPAHDDDPVGALQIKPRAARAVGVTGDLTDVQTNLTAGARYLVQLMDVHGARSLPALIAAWNAGPNRGQVGSVESGEIPDLTVTQHYVRRVIAFRAIYEARATAPS